MIFEFTKSATEPEMGLTQIIKNRRSYKSGVLLVLMIKTKSRSKTIREAFTYLCQIKF